MPNNEELLKELHELLHLEKKDLRTYNEKNNEINKIIEIWCNLSEKYQTEELLLSVLDRTKMNYRFYGKQEYFRENIDNVIHVFNGTKEILRNENTYLNFINHIKNEFRINDIKELLDDEKRPFVFKNEEDYLKLTLVFANNYFKLSDFIEKYVPIEYRSAEFYEKIFENQSQIGISYGGNFKKFWNLIPDNIKSKKIFLEICCRADSFGLRDLFDLAPKEYFDKEFVTKLPKVIGNLYNKIPNVLNSALSKLPQELLSQEFYLNIMNEIFKRSSSEYITQSIFEEVIPDKFKTKDMVLLFVKNSSNYLLRQILSNIPDNVKTKEFYNEFFKVYGSNPKSSGNSVYSSVSEVLKQIPKDYFTEQNLLNYIFQKKDDSKASGQLYGIIAKFVNEELKDRYPNGLSKDFYKQLIENNQEDELFTIFNSMPDEYKTEDMYLKSLEKNINNPALELFFIFKLMQELKKNPKLAQQFSAKFYEKLITSSGDMSHACSIYKTMPKEYQTKEQYLNMVSIFKSHKDMRQFIDYWMPEDFKTEEMYERISSIVKTITDENGTIRGNDATLLRNFIRNLPTDFKKKEEVIDLFSKFEDENVNIIYTPSNLIYLNRTYGNQKVIESKLLEILNKEMINVENGILNDKQFMEYENELNELLGLNMGVESKTELYGLNAIYLMISENDIPEETQKKVYEIINKKIINLKNDYNPKVISILSKMFENNNELFVTLDKKFIESDKYLELLGTEKFEILALYPDIQRQIFTLNENQLVVVVNMINYIIDNQKAGEFEDWIPITDKILRSFNSNNFSEILDKIQKKGFNELDEFTIKNLYTMISKEKNYFNIDTLEKLQNYENIKENICNDILSGKNTDNLPNDIKALSQKEQRKFAILQLKYGIDLNEATDLIERYGYDISDEMSKDEIFKVLEDIKEILENEDYDIFNNLKDREINFINIDSVLREKIKATYKDKLYSIKNNLQDETDKFGSTYNGKNIKVYQAKEDFNMIVHALGAYSGKGNIQNYRDEWNISKMRYHGLCTSYIGNNSIATARVKDVIYGFDSIESTPLLLSAPWDIGSNGANQKFVTSNMKEHIRFLNPKMQINCTRHTHNEMVFDRRNFKKGDISQKMQPSYIVYIPEYFYGMTSKEIDSILANSNRDDVIQKFMEKDELWQKTKKAATEFDIPIVIIDRLHYAQREHEKIEENLKLFEENPNPKLLEKIITEFENNRTGCREYHEAICDKFFSDTIMNSYLKRIEQAIEKEKEHPKLQLSNLQKLTELISIELENRNSFRKTQDDKIEKYWSEQLQDIESEKNKIIRRFKGLEEKDKNHELQFIMNIFNNAGIYTDERKYIKEEMYEQIADMKARNLYGGKLIHSDRHIQDVMLFSSILGEQFNLTPRQKNLLIEAAKFHDSGRESDGDRNHAIASAVIAGDKLKRMYSSEDLKIIQIAIEYHEIHEDNKGKLDLSKIQELFEKYELSENNYNEAMKISEILKDADALDRTRFAERGKLKEEYLHSNQAKSLVSFATALNEEYAKQDIEDMLEINTSIKDSVMTYKEKTGKTWLKVIRDIRTRKFIPKSSKKITIKEIAESSIYSLNDIEMLDREDKALASLVEKSKEGVMANEQS